MLLERFDVFLFDLDGVVYLGDELLPHARESLARLRSAGKTVLFLTNDPRPTRGRSTVSQTRRRSPPAGDLRFGVGYGEIPRTKWRTFHLRRREPRASF